MMHGLKMCIRDSCIDNLEQLTSYAPEFKGAPKFSSVFIQLDGVYENTDWDKEFNASQEVGIDTWIIQYAEGFNDSAEEKSQSLNNELDEYLEQLKNRSEMRMLFKLAKG